MGKGEGGSVQQAEHRTDSEGNNMQVYDVYTLLIKNEGRSCQDDCYLEEIGHYAFQYGTIL